MNSIKRISKNLKHILFISLLTLLGAFSLFWIPSLLQSFQYFFIYGEGQFQNLVYQYHLAPSTDKIAIIKIDEASLNYIQAAKSDNHMLAIPKSIYMNLTKNLQGIAKATAYDIVFQNQDTDEYAFAETLRSAKNVVIGTYASKGSCQDDAGGSIITCEGAPRSLYASGIAWGLLNMNDVGDSFRFSFQHKLKGTEYIHTLAYELYRKGGSGNTLEFPENQESEWAILIPFFGKEGVYPSHSLKDVLGMSKADLIQNFNGKYIFVGESGAGGNDMKETPVTGEMMDGVEFHAHLLDGLLQNKMLSKASDEVAFIVLIFLSIGMVSLYLFAPKFLSPILVILVFFMVIWTSRYLYEVQRIIVNIMPFFGATIWSYFVTYVYKFFVIDREKRELQSNFGHYIDPEVVREIAERDEPIELGGEKRELSILFSDIAGFTTLSEKLVPQDLFYLMTSYLSNMTDILIREGGTLDKYIGDAVMGFFGAPLPHADHAIRACRTALLMREQLPIFNTDIVSHGMDPVDFRVGIATGEVMVGNIGSHDRFNYTVLGDTVNLASRLEGTGKEYDVHIIISDTVRAQIGPEFSVRELDTIAVKGKTEGVRIYELIGFVAKISDRTIYTNYEQALALYRDGKYQEAGKIWYAQMEQDPPSRIMALRCASIIKGEVIVEKGIYHMTHK